MTLTVRDAAHPNGNKRNKLDAMSDHRGEFAFRVPPGEGNYHVAAVLKGYKPAAKDVSISGEERVDITLTLERDAK